MPRQELQPRGRRTLVAETSSGRTATVVRWVALLGGAALASMLVGFAVGLARPRPAGPGTARG